MEQGELLDMERVELLDIAVKAAKNAGAVIQKCFHKGTAKVTYKDKHNIVTETDKFSEIAILETLQFVFPRHSYFSEEKGFIRGDEDCLWVIDPLDGTTNYAQGLLHFCVSIAFYYRRVASVAVVYQPMRD